MAHDRGHGHDHGQGQGQGHEPGHGHEHGIASDADRRWLMVALGLISTFMAGEVVVGLLSGSLALLSDAAHMVTDAGAIALALVTMRLATRAPSGAYTYGLKRAEIFSAMANGVTLLVLALWLCATAVPRLIHPPSVSGLPVLVTALIGIVVNLLATLALGRASRESLNVRGAYLHVLTDLASFVATAIAGLIVLVTGYSRADTIATALVIGLMVHAGIGLVRDSGRVFLEAAPAGIDPAAIGTRLAEIPGIAEIHDLHVWQITSGEPAISAHILVSEKCDCHPVCTEVEQLLHGVYKIQHTTIQVDHATAARPPHEHCLAPHGQIYSPPGTPIA
jgi:cobalt-zinc-cadmium efflux system protein